MAPGAFICTKRKDVGIGLTVEQAVLISIKYSGAVGLVVAEAQTLE